MEHIRHLTSKPPQQCQQHVAHYHPRQQYTLRELILTLQKTYRGVSFALINVPALAFFLSTYDASKHGLAHVATALQLPRFHLHHFENHLISGMMAKVAGTILWAPMAKLNSLQSRHSSQDPLSFKNACRLARQVCQSTPSGILSLWSEYGTTLRALLPYTMLYFATYEQLKQLARSYFCEKQDHAGELRNRNSALHRGHRPLPEDTPSPLGLSTYMICVAGAVAIASTVCHTASALAGQFKELVYSHSTPSALSSFAKGTPHFNTSPNPTSPVLRVPSTPASHPTIPIGNALFARQQAQHTSLTTHTSATTPTTMTANMATTTATIMTNESTVRTATTTQSSARVSRRPLISDGCDKASSRVFQLRFPKAIFRGLGPRILWTAPNVVLTTAGFEVLRNMALAAA